MRGGRLRSQARRVPAPLRSAPRAPWAPSADRASSRSGPPGPTEARNSGPGDQGAGEGPSRREALPRRPGDPDGSQGGKGGRGGARGRVFPRIRGCEKGPQPSTSRPHRTLRAVGTHCGVRADGQIWVHFGVWKMSPWLWGQRRAKEACWQEGSSEQTGVSLLPRLPQITGGKGLRLLWP